MKIDREFFYKNIRSENLLDKLSQKQVDSLNVILDTFEKKGFTDLRWLAYMLGTTYHETAFTMLPIEEIGKGRGYKYGEIDQITKKNILWAWLCSINLESKLLYYVIIVES